VQSANIIHVGIRNTEDTQMTRTNILRSALIIPVVLGVAACGGGGGGDGGPAGPGVQNQPFENVSLDDVRNRTGLGAGAPSQFGNAVAVGLIGGAEALNGGARARDTMGTIGIASGNSADVMATFDLNDDGRLNVGNGGRDIRYDTTYSPANNYIVTETGALRVQETGIQAGGEDVLRIADVPSTTRQTVIYIPRDAAQRMHAGMIAHYEGQNNGVGGGFGIFGLDTSAQELAAQQGRGVAYTGIAAAAVSRTVMGTGGEGGYYEGTATTTVDFEANQLGAEAELQRTGTDFNAGLIDRITVQTENTFDANGTYAGQATYTGLESGPVVGSADGQFYGPGAETLGITFIGNGPNAAIAGGMVLNRTDD